MKDENYINFRSDVASALSKIFTKNNDATRADLEEAINWLQNKNFFNDDKMVLDEGMLAQLKQEVGGDQISEEQGAATVQTIKSNIATLIGYHIKEAFEQFVSDAQEDATSVLDVDIDDENGFEAKVIGKKEADANSPELDDEKFLFGFKIPLDALKFVKVSKDSNEPNVVDDNTFIRDLSRGTIANFSDASDDVSGKPLFSDEQPYAYYIGFTDFMRTWGWEPGDSDISSTHIWRGDDRKAPYSGYIFYAGYATDNAVKLYQDCVQYLPTVNDIYQRLKKDNRLLSYLTN